FEGTAFKVLDTSGNWLKIKTFDGTSGWVSKNYVAATADAVITASKLNMRSGAGTGYSVKRSLSYGTIVKVNSINGNWAHVTVNGVSGHVSVNYLEF
ncbi:MAG: SH3 domain-containing protein, partial [Clostridia bacterium]|nr:SH3 domain-containing protein [Clostridia bacterium]